jgi:hypothetical protein
MSLRVSPVSRNLNAQIMLFGLEFEDLMVITVLGVGRDADWTVSLLGSVSVLFADELGTSVDCGLLQRSCANAAEVWQTARVYRSPLQLVYKATRLLMP